MSDEEHERQLRIDLMTIQIERLRQEIRVENRKFFIQLVLAITAALGVGVAIVLSGLIFGAFHLANPDGLLVFVPISAIGMLFAWGYYYSGSLMAPMIAHFLFNLVSFVAGFWAE